MSDNKNLKPGWKIWRFDQIAQQVTERAEPTPDDSKLYVGLEHMDPGSLGIRRWGSQTDLIGTKFRMRKGDVLFARRNAYLKRVAIAPHDGLFSAHGMVLRPRPEAVLSDFLPFFMQSDLFMDRSIEISVGSLSPTINWKTMAAQEFALPPITEQARVVEILQVSRAVADEQADALPELQRLRQSAIDYLLSLPESGTFVRLEQVATMQNGRPFPGDEYAAEGTRLLRPGNLGASGYLTWLTDKTVCLDPKWETSAADFVIHPGDVVINLTAQSLEDGFMGRVCRAQEHDKSLLNQRIGRFRCDEDVLRPEFLFRCLQTSRFRQHAHANCEGSKVKHMFWQHLAKYEIAIPNISVQEEVIAQCASIDEAIRSLGSRLAASQQLAARLTNQLAGGT